MTVAQGLPRSQARARTARHGGKRLRAPFPLRCGALLIDYIALISLVVLGTLVARMLGGGARSAGNSAETAGIMLAVLMAVLNLGVIPGFTGLTLGKWATGLRIERNDGGPVWHRSRTVTSFRWLSRLIRTSGSRFHNRCGLRAWQRLARYDSRHHCRS